MKGLVILIALGVGGYYFATEIGFIKSGESEAVVAYNHFMDNYIIRRYDAALPYASSSAARKLSSENAKTTMKFMGQTINTPLADKGIVEASKVRVVEERVDGDSIHLELVYSASISWAGSTANKMSPGSWQRWDQTARMTNTSGEWKVASFESEKQTH